MAKRITDWRGNLAIEAMGMDLARSYLQADYPTCIVREAPKAARGSFGHDWDIRTPGGAILRVQTIVRDRGSVAWDRRPSMQDCLIELDDGTGARRGWIHGAHDLIQTVWVDIGKQFLPHFTAPTRVYRRLVQAEISRVPRDMRRFREGKNDLGQISLTCAIRIAEVVGYLAESDEFDHLLGVSAADLCGKPCPYARPNPENDRQDRLGLGGGEGDTGWYDLFATI